MKKYRTIVFVSLGVIIGIVGWRMWRTGDRQLGATGSTQFSTAINDGTDSAKLRSDQSSSLAERKALNDPKTLAFQAVLAAENSQSQDFYGRAIDQYGQPVVGATVLGTYLWVQGFDVGEKREQQTTATDSNGEFQFTGTKAARLAVAVSKAGYEMNHRGLAFKGPNLGNKTRSDARAVLTMWKLKGPESMVHAKVHAYVQCDGAATSYDLMTGKKDPNGTIVLKLTRTPINIQRGHPFDWQAVVELRDEGGFQIISDVYPNEAPMGGYEPQIKITRPADMNGWDAAFERSYYFKSGKVYGRMTVSIQADFQPPPTSFDVEIYANPSGSRNLEFDPTKVVKPSQPTKQ